MFKTLALLILLSGCQAHVGVAFHPEGELNNNKDQNPLGIIRLTKEGYNGIELFCEHVSSLPDDDKGLNMCGATMRIY